MRPDFVDQAHREPAIVHRWEPDRLEPVVPGPVRARGRIEKIDEIAALVIAFIAASFIFAHLLVAAGVGLTCP